MMKYFSRGLVCTLGGLLFAIGGCALEEDGTGQSSDNIAYDWATDDEPEPIEAFEDVGDTNDNGSLSTSEAKLLRACYQKLVMNCYQIHEEVRVQVSEPASEGVMNRIMQLKYYAAEKDNILACLADSVTSQNGN